MKQKRQIVELIEDTDFYKKGRRAVVVCDHDSQNGNPKKMEIRWIGEKYIGNDVDIYPKNLFKIVE